MICKNCGKTLIKIRDLTEDELKNIMYLSAKETSLWEVANTLIMQSLDKKIKKEYVKIFKKIAEVKLARVQINRDILGNTNNILIDGSIYTHENI